MYEGLYPPQMISTGSMAEEVEGWRRERMNVGWGGVRGVGMGAIPNSSFDTAVGRQSG